MKAIILSVQPQWLEMILNGKKTIEIRKSMPKCNLPIDVYLYCTKKLPELYTATWQIPGRAYQNGKVVAKFTLNKCHTLKYNYDFDEYGTPYEEDTFLQDACLTQRELLDYGNASVSRPGIKPLYAWQIDNLVIFDTPKELSEFYVERYAAMPNGIFPCNEPLTISPQSYRFVEVSDNG